MSETIDLWKGEFGVEYTARNRVNWEDRVSFWDQIIDRTMARGILDVGCNAGWNMLALRKVDNTLEMSGVDVNAAALEQASAQGFDVKLMPAHEIVAEFGRGVADLVVTSGVLIHIAPDLLAATMEAIVDVSAQYVLAIEYASDEEVQVEYRGGMNRLWKRPFGKLYEELGLSLVETGPAQGFDDCTYWLLEKQA